MQEEKEEFLVSGKVLLSFEVVPKELAEKFENADGRKDPNFYPTLPDPVGTTVPVVVLVQVIPPAPVAPQDPARNSPEFS